MTNYAVESVVAVDDKGHFIEFDLGRSKRILLERVEVVVAGERRLVDYSRPNPTELRLKLQQPPDEARARLTLRISVWREPPVLAALIAATATVVAAAIAGLVSMSGAEGARDVTAEPSLQCLRLVQRLDALTASGDEVAVDVAIARTVAACETEYSNARR